jgi:TonB family protein
MMTNRQARNRLGWTVALVGALALTPALLLALPAPAPVGVGGVTAAVARWADQIVLREETPSRPAPMFARAVRVTPPKAPSSSFLHGDTAMLEIARSASRGASKDTVPARGMVYVVAMLDRKPVLTNMSQVQSMLSHFYPRMLEDAGIGGTAVMSFVVTTEGTVDPSTIGVVSATHEQFSEASRKIVEKFIFTPGLYHGKAVRTLIQMPITWAPNTSRPVEGTAYGAGGAAGGAEGGGAHLSSPVLLAIREIVMKSYPELMRSTTGTRKILGVVVHPDGRIKHMELSNGYFQPDGRAALTFDSESSRGGRTFGETPAAIRHVEIMTSPDLATIAKDLNSVIWVTLKE